MLPPPMRRPIALILLAGATLLAVAACGAEEELEVKEGEPVELEGLRYNVRLSRFLNPNDREDAAYLVGRPRAPAGKDYLGVFIRIENDSESSVTPPAGISVRDTSDNEYEPVASASLYALDFDTAIEAGADVPAPDSPAASGPVNGAMVLFLVDRSVSENRPLRLEIPAPGGESGSVELDI